MLKNFFKKKSKPQVIQFQENLELRLLIEIAYIDGEYSKNENNVILDKARKLVGDEEAQALITKLQHKVKVSTSLYPTINEVNKSFNRDEKLSMLEHLWELIAADSIAHVYEESLYFKIAELIKIKRSIANKIKLENS